MRQRQIILDEKRFDGLGKTVRTVVFGLAIGLAAVVWSGCQGPVIKLEPGRKYTYEELAGMIYRTKNPSALEMEIVKRMDKTGSADGGPDGCVTLEEFYDWSPEY